MSSRRVVPFCSKRICRVRKSKETAVLLAQAATTNQQTTLQPAAKTDASAKPAGRRRVKAPNPSSTNKKIKFNQKISTPATSHVPA